MNAICVHDEEPAISSVVGGSTMAINVQGLCPLAGKVAYASLSFPEN